MEAPHVVTTAQPISARTPGQPTGPGVKQPNQVAPMVEQKETTNVVINAQPGAWQQAEREWTSGIWDCGSDMETCCLASFCSQCLVCMLAQDMGEDCCSAFCYTICNPSRTFGLRVYLRGKENIKGRLFEDFQYSTSASCCALAQVAREVKLIKSIRGAI